MLITSYKMFSWDHIFINIVIIVIICFSFRFVVTFYLCVHVGLFAASVTC